MQKLILIGGGGHCHACIDVIENTNQYDIAGIIDVKEKVGQKVLGYDIIGTDAEIQQFINPETYFFITVGHIKTAEIRKKIFQNLENLNAPIATIIASSAIVSKHSQIGKGTILMHKTTVSAGTTIGKNCIINTGADIEHDSCVRHHAHVSTHAVVNGNCKIGEGVFVGSNSTIFQGVEIAENSIISAGSIVRKNIKQSGIYLDNKLVKNV